MAIINFLLILYYLSWLLVIIELIPVNILQHFTIIKTANYLRKNQPESLSQILGFELQYKKLLSKNALTWIYNEYDGENSELKKLKKG